VIDLLCVVADKNMEAAVSGVLDRPQALGIRAIRSEVFVHPRRDPGCFHESAELVAGRRAEAQKALVVLDAAWSGAPADSGEELERLLEAEFQTRDLDEWARAVVIEPELEVWVFSDSPHVPQVLEWDGDTASLRQHIEEQGQWAPGVSKPHDPKAALEAVLRRARKPRSSALFRKLAAKVSLRQCEDRAFERFRSCLQEWFPEARRGEV